MKTILSIALWLLPVFAAQAFPCSLSEPAKDSLPGTANNRVLTGAPGRAHEEPMPIALLRFNAAAMSNDAEVLLQWKVADQWEIDRYRIERSADGAEFVAIAEIKPEADTNDYSVKDCAPLPGRNYYRLHIIGKEGGESYSQVLQVFILSRVFATVWPVPATSHLTIEINTTALLNTMAALMNMQGKIVGIYLISSSKQELDIDALPVGLYHLKFAKGEALPVIKQ